MQNQNNFGVQYTAVPLAEGQVQYIQPGQMLMAQPGQQGNTINIILLLYYYLILNNYISNNLDATSSTCTWMPCWLRIVKFISK